MTLCAGKVDFYAGIDFSQDNETYQYLGTEGGYINAEASAASFRYPISIAYHNYDTQAGSDSTGSLYVVDNANNAIRRVAVVVATPAPSSLYNNPDPSSAPSRTPSQRPTVSAEPTVTYRPSGAPSLQPSLSIAPTSNPSKRPTRRPTRQPTTLVPTASDVWVQDNSFFSDLGLGTVHVGAGMYMLSVLVGLLLSGLVGLAYTQRHVDPRLQLRTSADHLSAAERAQRSCRIAGRYVVFWMGACIPGSAFHQAPEELDQEQGQGLSDSYTDSYADSDSQQYPQGASRGRSAGDGASFLSGVLGRIRGLFASRGSEGRGAEEEPELADEPGDIRNLLQSVRDSTFSEQQRRRHAPSGSEASSSYAHSSTSPQEHRELGPRRGGQGDGEGEDDGGINLDESTRSCAPMIVRTFGSSNDGL